MKERSNRQKKLALGERGILLFMLICINCIILIPVWQAGEYRSITMEMENTVKTIAKLEEEQRMLQSQIAYARSAEWLIDASNSQEIYFQQISPGNVVYLNASLSSGV